MKDFNSTIGFTSSSSIVASNCVKDMKDVSKLSKKITSSKISGNLDGIIMDDYNHNDSNNFKYQLWIRR